ncbi:MAG TPA: hypothetical protein VK213_06245, partial [Bacteroidales bacterium]|nr:hypothetical protein [Bacteroidales bacterium]
GNILIGTGTTLSSVGVTGDIGLTSLGVASITAGSIVNGDINNAAGIAGTKINPEFGNQTVSIGTGTGTTAGTIVLHDATAGTSNTTTIQSNANVPSSYTLTLPGDDGTANQFLQTDGNGVLSWGSPIILDAAADGATKGISAYTSTDFNSAAGLISLDYVNGQKAGAATNGFLSSADWSTFNGKQNALVNSAGLAGALSDETGTGAAVFAESPTLSKVVIGAGTAAAGTAPLKFNSGTLLTTTEAGAIEFNNDKYYATITTGSGTDAARREISLGSVANALVKADRFTTSNSLSDVQDMSFAIGANETWSFEFNLSNGCDGAGGTNFGIAIPSGTFRATVIGRGGNLSSSIDSDIITELSPSTAISFCRSNTNLGWTRITGVVVAGATGGNISLQFSSSTLTQQSTIYAKSYFTARRIY